MRFKRLVTLLLCGVMVAACFSAAPHVSAKTVSQIESEISQLQNKADKIAKEIAQLKKDKANQDAIKAKLDEQISNIQRQIAICNSKIEATNALIADNDKEIAQKNKEIDVAVFEYKQRIRTIYMSSSAGNGIEILLGAETFADFIALSQASLNISRRDKRMIEDIVEMIGVIEEKTAENRALIEEQKAVKATLAKKQKDLDAQVAEINSVISSINSDISGSNSEKNKYMQDIKALEKVKEQLSRIEETETIDSRPFDGFFSWPVPGFTNRTSEYGSRWSRHHAGIDIAQSGIANARVVAVASGKVKIWCNSCTHNYGKWNGSYIWSCGCGGGYGNYVSVDHGYHEGAHYRTVYAHLSSITVSDGQMVGKGQTVGTVGTTGHSSGYHLHFEVRKNGVAVNPMNYY